jgi:23S rRNA (cytosine1962-C5)-methyltransferase
MEALKNRIKKNYKKLKKWANKAQFEAIRIYDRDMPEFPFVIDKYKNNLIVWERGSKDVDPDHREKNIIGLRTLLAEIFETTANHVFFKVREKKEGRSQYEKEKKALSIDHITEGYLEFEVNYSDYLDTGLFLDHRPFRQNLLKENLEKKTFLNLFCYTGSVGVAAAVAGARVVSVDMSNTYMEWCRRNFEMNDINCDKHEFIVQNAMEFLAESEKKVDIIFLDPPTFSNSKRMDSTFEVEKDQEFLVDNCMRMLRTDGVLYFSNNKRKFKLLDSLKEKYQIKDITKGSIPMDFRDEKIHHFFEIRALNS